jgi:hypothetical protein
MGADDPKYGPGFDPNAGGGGQPDPDAGKDLSYLVPHLQIVWSGPPTFNADPPNVGDGGDGGDGDKDVPPCGPIQVNLATVRGAEQRMLGCGQNMVFDYEFLRGQVMALKDTVFGQNATVTQVTGGQSGVSGNSYNGSGAGTRDEEIVPSPIREGANKFASEINPAQEKVLWQIANTVELLGQYIAAVNRAGQTYGRADRLSTFPGPPSDPT